MALHHIWKNCPFWGWAILSKFCTRFGAENLWSLVLFCKLKFHKCSSTVRCSIDATRFKQFRVSTLFGPYKLFCDYMEIFRLWQTWWAASLHNFVVVLFLICYFKSRSQLIVIRQLYLTWQISEAFWYWNEAVPFVLAV